MSRKTKAQRREEHAINLENQNSNIARIIGDISRNDGVYITELDSASYGKVEAWNLATCWIQNAEHDKTPLADYVKCQLCEESKQVGAYFRAAGINF